MSVGCVFWTFINGPELTGSAYLVLCCLFWCLSANARYTILSILIGGRPLHRWFRSALIYLLIAAIWLSNLVIAGLAFNCTILNNDSSHFTKKSSSVHFWKRKEITFLSALCLLAIVIYQPIYLAYMLLVKSLPFWTIMGSQIKLLYNRRKMQPRVANKEQEPTAETFCLQEELSEAAQLLNRSNVLSTFRCPFEVEENVCPLEQGKGCFFGHQNARSQQSQSLTKLPSYLCTYRLLNSCPVSGESCSNGLHLGGNLNDLLNLTYFERRNKRKIDAYFGPDRDRLCCICQEAILSKVLSSKRRFALLESCNHVFCADCYRQWSEEENRQSNLREPLKTSCPICRTVSKRFIVSRRVTENAQEKMALFAL